MIPMSTQLDGGRIDSPDEKTYYTKKAHNVPCSSRLKPSLKARRDDDVTVPRSTRGVPTEQRLVSDLLSTRR